jgi:hypothetical protein
MIFALIKDNKVVNVIVSQPDFISQIESSYDACVRIDELEVSPAIGWDYVDSVFINPNEEII